jgi:CMP-N-acetylneuraminic acid synthetase
MATATTTTVSNTSGLAEDFEDIIFDVSPTDTPMLTMAKRKKATARYHQWQTDSLAAASSNKAEEVRRDHGRRQTNNRFQQRRLTSPEHWTSSTNTDANPK